MKMFIPMILASSILLADPMEITFQDLTPSHVEAFSEGKMDCIVHVHEGDELPLYINLSGDTVAFKTSPENGRIIALRSFYIHVEETDILFSLDKTSWLPPWEFFTGSLSAGLGTEVEPFATIGLHADVR